MKKTINTISGNNKDRYKSGFSWLQNTQYQICDFKTVFKRLAQDLLAKCSNSQVTGSQTAAVAGEDWPGHDR